MSMSATFVQVDSALLEDPEGLERHFFPDFAYAAVDSAQMRAELERSVQLMAQSHPELREQLEAQLAQMYSSNGDAKSTEGMHGKLELDKAWHGLHYVLSGTVEIEAGASPLSQVVLGGTEIGEDFSGYGAARSFTAAEVSELAAALAGVDEDEVMERFDPERMAALQIYPFGWDDPDDREWLLESLRDLRRFYGDAAANGRAIVTCLV
jgi:Domain of unknown function (DUF1877)